MAPAESDPPRKGQGTEGSGQAADKQAPVKSAGLSKQQNPKPAETSGQGPRSKAGTPKTGNVTIQIGAFGQELPAKSLMEKLQEMGFDAYLQTQVLANLGLVYRVRIKGYTGLSEARTVIAQLKEQGFKDVFIVQPEGR